MTSSSPSGPLLDQLMYRPYPSQAEFHHSVSPRPDFYRTLPKEQSIAFTKKPTLGSKRVRESAQPGAPTASVQSTASAVIGTPLDYRQTPAATSLLSQSPSVFHLKQQQHHQWDPVVARDFTAQMCSASDTSSPVSPLDAGFGTDCSDDLDSGAESPSQTIELAGVGRLLSRAAQGPSLYYLPSADGGAAPLPGQPATQMRPSVSGGILCELSPRAEESVRPATVSRTSLYGASGFAFTSPTVTPVSARVPTFCSRKQSTETNSTDLKQPSFPFDLTDSFPLCPSVGEHADSSAELSSLSSASPVPPDHDGLVPPLSDGGLESDTDGESPLKRARHSTQTLGPILASAASSPQPSFSGFKCGVCSRTLRTEAHLACHMGVHTGERPCECPTCGQGFKTATDLANHARTHSADKPFECAACSKAFKRRWELTRHMRVHTQDARPFECAECGKFFQTKTTLASHMRIHSDDKPFGCSVCSKTFKRKGELTLHMRTHTGERPFKCPYCHKGFKQKGTLTQHLPTHTDSRPFTCSQCSSHFKHKSSLTRHVRCHKAAEAMAAMGVPAQLRAQLQMRLELDVLKSESEPVDTVASDAQLPETDSEWLEACLKSTLSSSALPLPLPLPSAAAQDPELDPALTCFQCLIPFDHVNDLTSHINESHPLPLTITEPSGLAPASVLAPSMHTPSSTAAALPTPSPITVPALPLPASSVSSAPCVRFDAVFGPRAKSKSAGSAKKKQPKPVKDLRSASPSCAKGSSGHFCPSCGKHFKHKYSLSRHTAKHHNHGGVWALAACPMCPQSFDSASLLSRHMVAAHGPSARPSICSSVGPSPPSSTSLHYSVSPVGDLARTFLFDGEVSNLCV